MCHYAYIFENKMLMFQNSISEMGELLAKYKSHIWFLPDSSTSAPNAAKLHQTVHTSNCDKTHFRD